MLGSHGSQLKPSRRKSKRARRFLALEGEETFETTKDESKCYVERIDFRNPTSEGKASTTFNSFLKSTGLVEQVAPGSSEGNRNGEILKFNCKKLRRYNVLIDPKWLDEIQAKRDKMFEKRENRPEWQSYKRINSEYTLSDEDLENLETLEIVKDGQTKTYERQYNTIVNGSYPMKQRSGGYYSEYNNIPDVVRVQRQNSRGEHLAICDQSSAHGYFLYVLLKRLIEFIEKRDGKVFAKAKGDLDKLASDLNSRKLYEYIPKKGFVAFLNAKYGEFTKPYIKDAYHAFEERYKALYRFFLGLKNQHDHQLYRPITHLQTIMMEEGAAQCLEWDFDAQILGDELEVPESQIMRVKDLMLDLIFKHTGLEGWVKVTIHDKEDQRFRYQTKAPCPEGLCPNCWNENKAIRLASPFPCGHIKAKTDCQIQPEASMGAQTQDKPIF